MGYTTDFTGSFQLNTPLTDEQSKYLHKFNRTRRMKLDPSQLQTVPDPIRTAVGLPLGLEGEYFVGFEDEDQMGYKIPRVDGNKPPTSQPGLWCGWCPTSDNTGIEWDGGEKFYYYSEWLDYLIQNFIKPWNLVLNGVVKWQGQRQEDTGEIVVKDNIIQIVSSQSNLKKLYRSFAMY